MTFQPVLPFDENYAWENLIKNLKRLSQGEKIVYYGIKDRKIILKCLKKDFFLVSSYSKQSLQFNIEQEGNLRFIEVAFMSTIMNKKHVHIYEKSATAAQDWRKQIYRCKDPHCHHYLQAQFIEGKIVQCYKCKRETIIAKPQLWKRNKHLICILCSKSPKKDVLTKGIEVIQGLFDGETTEDPILSAIQQEIENDKKTG